MAERCQPGPLGPGTDELLLRTDQAEDPIVAVWRALGAQGKGCIMQDLPHLHPKYVATMIWAQSKNTSTYINVSCNTDYSSQPVT